MKTTHGPYVRTYIAFRAPGRGEDGWQAVSRLARILAGGRSSPFNRRLVDGAGLAQQVRVHLEPMQEASTVAFAATAAPHVPHERLEAALFETLDELLATGFDKAMVAVARKRSLVERYAQEQDLSRRADRLAASALFAAGDGWLEGDAENGELDAALLLAAGRACFRPEIGVVLSVVPSGGRP